MIINTTVLVIKHCTNVQTATYLCTSKIKNASPESINKVKQSALIKEWEKRIEQNEALAKNLGLFQKQLGI